MIRVLLVHDEALTREGLRKVLGEATGIEVVGLAPTTPKSPTGWCSRMWTWSLWFASVMRSRLRIASSVSAPSTSAPRRTSRSGTRT